MTPLQRNAELCVLAEKFRAVLTEAATRRDERQFIAYGHAPDGHQEMAWAAYERNRMLEAVNAERQVHGLSPVSAGAVWDAERLAMGHVDYADKFGWGCAELVMHPAGDETAATAGED